MYSLIDSSQLLERACRSQLRACSAVAIPGDKSLVYVDEAAKPETHSNGIREITRKQAKAVQDMLRDSSTSRREKGEGVDEYKVRRIRG